jgi:hypothetical protein
MGKGKFRAFEIEIQFSREAADLVLAASSEFKKVLRQRAVGLAKTPEGGAARTVSGETEKVEVGPDQVREALLGMGLDYLLSR